MRQRMNMIAIFTDFGASGPYTGQMHAALYAQAPGIDVVDLFPDLPPFNVRAAASLLPAYSRFLPDGVVCLCVVDPGVGTDRRALALRADGRWFVGPDNGLFRNVVRLAAHTEAHEILWRPEHLSDSFHGRDLFAPVAARLALGDSEGLRRLDTRQLVSPDWPDILYEVVYVDHYGNAITGIPADRLADGATLDVAGRRCRYRRTFAEAEPGELFWYRNANGLVEVALNKSSAAASAGLRVGDSTRLLRA